jgi:predicted AlkP superfamily phosphohydrolase/phosphomutase
MPLKLNSSELVFIISSRIRQPVIVSQFLSWIINHREDGEYGEERKKLLVLPRTPRGSISTRMKILAANPTIRQLFVIYRLTPGRPCAIPSNVFSLINVLQDVRRKCLYHLYHRIF